MTTDVAREVGELLAEQLTDPDETTRAQLHAWAAMRDQRDQARRFAVAFEQDNENLTRINELLTAQLDDMSARCSTSLLLVEEILDHAPEECSCDQGGYVCIFHKLADTLGGVAR